MPHFGSWVTFAESDHLDKLVGMIATGDDATTAAPSDEVRQFLATLPAGSRVLDFGCGVGRNALAFAEEFPHLEVHGYDSPQMLARVAEYARHKGLDASGMRQRPNWQELTGERFDVVYATLVFQHVACDELATYLSDIKRMTPVLLVHGRRKNDHCSGGTWRVLESCGLVPANADEIGYSADGPDEEHLPLCIYRIE